MGWFNPRKRFRVFSPEPPRTAHVMQRRPNRVAMKKILIMSLVFFGAGCDDDAPTAPTGPAVSFFVTSVTSVTGNLGGLVGADATCQRLAGAAGQGARTWRAYLSVGRDPANGNQTTHARDRIGAGPWYANLAVLAAERRRTPPAWATPPCSSTSAGSASAVSGPDRPVGRARYPDGPTLTGRWPRAHVRGWTSVRRARPVGTPMAGTEPVPPAPPSRIGPRQSERVSPCRAAAVRCFAR